MIIHQLSSISTDSPKIRSNAEKVDGDFIRMDDARGYPLFNQLKSSLVSGLVFQNASYKCQNRQSLEELAINESLKPSTSPLEISTASSSF